MSLFLLKRVILTFLTDYAQLWALSRGTHHPFHCWSVLIPVNSCSEPVETPVNPLWLGIKRA